jgi:hypothetical protein
LTIARGEEHADTMSQAHDGTRPRIAIGLDEAERRDLVRRAAERSIRESRPVSVSEIAREALRRGLTEEKGHAA